MIPKIYKRCAIGFVMLVFILVPFLFWMGGWNFERNEAGGACVLFTLMVSGIGTGVIMGVGSDNRE